jgi:hypothetical protein
LCRTALPKQDVGRSDDDSTRFRDQAAARRERISILAVCSARLEQEIAMNNIIWIIGAVVVVLAVLSFLGLR